MNKPNKTDQLIGKNIAKLRTSRNISTAILSEQINLSIITIYKIEYAERRIAASDLLRIAKYFNVKIETLYN